MLPNTVYAVGGILTEMGGVKIIFIQKKYEADTVSTGR
jgi:hypothetical protein